MEKITDVFEFATRHPDYWAEFLTADAYGSELTDEEVIALNAARKHIEEGIFELLRCCGKQLESKLTHAGVVSKRFQPEKTAQNRKVRLDAPAKVGDRLYGLEFSLEADDKNERIQLYALLVPKVAAFDGLRARLRELNVPFEVSGSLIYGGGILIEKDKKIEDLANSAAQSAVELFKCLE